MGLDYTKTFSLIVKLVTIWTILSLVVSSQWPLQQLDIQNAFLHGDLEDDVYMKQPPKFINLDLSTHVYKLQKSTYS